MSRAERRAVDQTLLFCVAVCVMGALTTRLLVSGPERMALVGTLLLLLSLPILQRSLTRWLGSRFRPRAWHTALPIGLQLLLMSLLPTQGLADTLLVLATWLAVQLGLRREHLPAAALLVALTPLQLLAAMAAAPSPVWLIGFPLALVVSSLAAALLSMRYHLERVETQAARAHVRAWLELEKTRTPRGAWRSRLAPAAGLSLALFAGTVLTYPALVAAPRPSFNPRSPRLGGAGSASATARERREAVDSLSGGGSGSFPGDIRPGGGLGDLSYETVMTVQAFSDRAPAEAINIGPLYLRAICLDTFTETGLRSAETLELETLEDADDGRADGWILLGSEGNDAGFELEIRHNILRVPGNDAAVLFAVRPVLALQLEEVRQNEDFMLALPARVNVGEVAFRQRLEREPLARWNGEELRASHPDPRFLQRPARDAEMAWIEQLAQRWSSGASNDFERITAIVGHLQSEFGYTTKTSDVPGVQGIVNFLRREQGHCTSFAAAAVLLLRTLDLPSRVVTGFLGEQYDAELDLYSISRSNGHAWIEVHLEGLGWQPFDPTPGGARSQAQRAALAGEDDGLREWTRRISSDLAAWARSGADEAYFGQLLDTLLDGPRAAMASTRRRPLLAVGLVLLVILIGFLLRPGRRRARRADRQPPKSVELDLYERWLTALQASGTRRSASKTLREWTKAIELPEHHELRDQVPRLVELFYRARFGAEELTASEQDQIRDCISKLETQGSGADEAEPLAC